MLSADGLELAQSSVCVHLYVAESSAVSLSLCILREPPPCAALEHIPLSSEHECVPAVNEKRCKLSPRG